METKPIGAICELLTGGTPSKSVPEYFEPGEIQWLVSGDIHQKEIHDCKGRISKAGMKNSNARLLPVNSVMMALNGQGKTRGTVAMLKTSATCNQSLLCLNPIDSNTLLPEYLFWNLESRYDELRRITGDDGNDRRGLTMGLVKNICVPMPPVASQRRVVDMMSKAVATLGETQALVERNRANARELFESYLNGVFERKGDGWVETTLQEVLRVQPRNGWSPPAANHSDKGTPVLTLSSVTGFKFRADKIKHTSATVDSNRHYWVRNGDLLITRSNTAELVGHVAIASGISKPTIYPDLIMKMVPDEELVTSKFLYYQLRSTTLRESIMAKAHGANPTMKKVSKGDVQSLPVNYPTLSEQEHIVAGLEAIIEETKQLEATYQQKLSELDALKKGLLGAAFRGEL